MLGPREAFRRDLLWVYVNSNLPLSCGKHYNRNMMGKKREIPSKEIRENWKKWYLSQTLGKKKKKGGCVGEFIERLLESGVKEARESSDRTSQGPQQHKVEGIKSLSRSLE